MQTHHGKFSHLFIALAARFQEHNPMRRHCQFTVKRSERSVDLTVTPEQQPCGVLEYCQELADLTKMNSPPASHEKCTFCKDFDKNVKFR